MMLDRPIYVPPPLKGTHKRPIPPSLTRKRKAMERVKQIFFRPVTQKHSVWLDSPIEGTDMSGHERGLYAAVIRGAMRDYATGITSNIPAQQRQALNAYWWVQGLPLVLTYKARDSPDAWPELVAGRTRGWKCRPDQPLFRDIPLTFSDLVAMRDTEQPYYPQPWSDMEDLHRSMSFLTCCQVCNLDPSQVRTFMHLIRPDMR